MPKRTGYKSRKRSPAKLVLRKVVNKKNMKKTAKTIFILGVWYYIGNMEMPAERKATAARNRKQSRRENRFPPLKKR